MQATDTQVDAMIDAGCDVAKKIEGWFVDQTAIEPTRAGMKANLPAVRQGLAAMMAAAGLRVVDDKSGLPVTF